MRSILAAAVVALTGCGTDVAQLQRYPVNLDGQLCYGQMYSELELKPAILERNAGIARDILVDGKVFRDTQEFCTWTRDLLIVVRADYHIMGNNFGAYSPFHGIELNQSGRSLLHEVLHSVDYGRLSPYMGSHDGWKVQFPALTHTYEYMDKLYWESIKDELQFFL